MIKYFYKENNTTSPLVERPGEVFIGGFCNTVSGAYSSILGGSGNSDSGYNNVFIAGSGITAVAANTLHVNCLNANSIPG